MLCYIFPCAHTMQNMCITWAMCGVCIEWVCNATYCFLCIFCTKTFFRSFRQKKRSFYNQTALLYNVQNGTFYATLCNEIMYECTYIHDTYRHARIYITHAHTHTHTYPTIVSLTVPTYPERLIHNFVCAVLEKMEPCVILTMVLNLVVY